MRRQSAMYINLAEVIHRLSFRFHRYGRWRVCRQNYTQFLRRFHTMFVFYFPFWKNNQEIGLSVVFYRVLKQLFSFYRYIDNHQVFPAYCKSYFQQVYAISRDKNLNFDSSHALYFQFTNHYYFKKYSLPKSVAMCPWEGSISGSSMILLLPFLPKK